MSLVSFIYLSLSLSLSLSLVKTPAFKLGVTWLAWLFMWIFSAVIFKRWPFRSVATYCQVYLFALEFVVVIFLFFPKRVIKFHIKTKCYICFQTFYPFVFSFHLLVSCQYLFIFFNSFYMIPNFDSPLKSWPFVWKCCSTNIRFSWAIHLILCLSLLSLE